MSRISTHRPPLAAVVTLTAVVLLALPALGAGQGSRRTTPSFTITIGSAHDFSGDLSVLGKPDDTAVRLGAKYAQSALRRSGIDVTVKVATEDTQGKSTAAVEAATKLIQSDHANVILGPESTAETIPMVQSADMQNTVPQITMASSPLITGVKDKGLLFRTVPSDTAEAKILAKLAGRVLGKRARLNTGARNDAAGTAFQSAFEKAWKAQGGKIGKSVRWNPDQPTYDSEAQKLVSGSPAGWMIYDFPGTWEKFEPALVRTGNWNPAKTFGGDGLGTMSKEAAQKAAGMRGLYIGARPGATLSSFNKLWKQYTKTHMIYAEPQLFDAVQLAVLAAVRGGSADGKTIAKNLRAVSGPPGKKYSYRQLPQALKAVAAGKDIDYEGASGSINWNRAGDISSVYYTIWQWKKDGSQKLTGAVGGTVK